VGLPGLSTSNVVVSAEGAIAVNKAASPFRGTSEGMSHIAQGRQTSLAFEPGLFGPKPNVIDQATL